MNIADSAILEVAPKTTLSPAPRDRPEKAESLPAAFQDAISKYGQGMIESGNLGVGSLFSFADIRLTNLQFTQDLYRNATIDQIGQILHERLPLAELTSDIRHLREYHQISLKLETKDIDDLTTRRIDYVISDLCSLLKTIKAPGYR